MAQGLALLAAGYVRPASLLLTPILLAVLALGRRSLPRGERGLWLATAAANAASLAFTWPILGTINVWLID